jgi:hypothetical protein
MLAGMLLHVVEATLAIDSPVDFGFWERGG